MKKAVVLLIMPILVACGEATHHHKYVSKWEFNRLKEKVERHDFLIKQTAYAVVDVKKAIKEINKEFRKQNEINRRLFEEIEQIKRHLEKKKTIGIVNASTLNLRESPSLTSPVVLVLLKGDKVEILTEKGNWYKVKVNGKEGYVYKKYIKTVER